MVMPNFEKLMFCLISFNFLIGASSCTKVNKDHQTDKYVHEEKVFLEYLIKSNLLEKSYKKQTTNSDLNNNVKVFNIYDSLLVFENLGVTEENIKSIINSGDDCLEMFKFDVEPKKTENCISIIDEINIVNSDTSMVSFDNSFYKLSRVSFNNNYTEALIAIELVCFDCGGLVLYKFKRLSNGNWKMESLINIWIS